MNGEALVVDTDVVSYVFKADTRAEVYRPHLVGKTLVLSFMSVAELYRWAEEHNWRQNRRAALEQHLRNFVVYSCNRELCRTWARVMAQAQSVGHQLNCADGWVAATAVLHGIPLVTHNQRDYEGRPGLQIICETDNLSDEQTTARST